MGSEGWSEMGTDWNVEERYEGGMMNLLTTDGERGGRGEDALIVGGLGLEVRLKLLVGCD